MITEKMKNLIFRILDKFLLFVVVMASIAILAFLYWLDKVRFVF